MTRLLAIGDIHLHPGPRQADRLRALDQIVTEGLALSHLGAWLIPGDIFHQRSTVEDRNAFAQQLQLMADRAPCLLVPGNHDAPGDLQIFGKLKAAHHVYVVDRPTCVRLRLATGEYATCFFLPYPSKAGLTSLGIVPADVADVAGEALDAIFMLAAGELERAKANGDLTFMIGHANISGAIASNGQPQVGMEISVNRGHLDRLGAIPKIFSHIHKAQEIGGALYTGSICRLSWGEVEPKRYLVIEARDFGGTRGWENNVTSHPIDVAPMFHVEGTLTRKAFHFEHDEWMCTACGGTGDGERGADNDTLPCVPCAGSGHRSWKGCEVRVRYRFNKSERGALDTARILAEFAEAARLELEPIAIADRELRAPEVAAARTLSEKLAAYSRVDQLAPSVAEKLALLEHADAVTVLTKVQNELVRLEAGEKELVAACL